MASFLLNMAIFRTEHRAVSKRALRPTKQLNAPLHQASEFRVHGSAAVPCYCLEMQLGDLDHMHRDGRPS